MSATALMRTTLELERRVAWEDAAENSLAPEMQLREDMVAAML